MTTPTITVYECAAHGTLTFGGCEASLGPGDDCEQEQLVLVRVDSPNPTIRTREWCYTHDSPAHGWGCHWEGAEHNINAGPPVVVVRGGGAAVEEGTH